MDLKVDMNPDSPSFGDLVFINGQSPVQTGQGDDVAQRLFIKLRTFKGEWFLNTETGVPYFQSIFGKNRSKSSVDMIFQEQIMSERGVLEITEFNSLLDNARRTYSLSFRVRTEQGETETIFI